MQLLEIHALQNFVPSLLNRDDTGSHKDCVFGGRRRARISSQCWKRAVRAHFKDSQLLEAESLALRSRLFHEELEKLVEPSTSELASYVAEAVLLALGLFHEEEKTSEDYQTRKLQSEYLVFLGRDNLGHLASTVSAHVEEFKKAAQEVKAQREKERARPKPPYKGSFEKKDEVKAKVDKILGKEICGQLNSVLSASRALDLNLFGRMLADRPELNVDASCQVAHAISTHEVSRDYDYYTAVDDLQKDDNAGAGMLGNTEFSSACYYRYSLLNLGQLVTNMGDAQLTLEGAEAFVRAFVSARPTAKQNAFAAHNWPSYVLLRWSSNGQPFNLANAFERSVPSRANGWVESSIQAFETEWKWHQDNYGLSGSTSGWARHSSELAKTGSMEAALEELKAGLQQILVL